MSRIVKLALNSVVATMLIVVAVGIAKDAFMLAVKLQILRQHFSSWAEGEVQEWRRERQG
jgi:hypothetical protein